MSDDDPSTWGRRGYSMANPHGAGAYGAVAYSPQERRFGYSWGQNSEATAEAGARSSCDAPDAYIVCWAQNLFVSLAVGENCDPRGAWNKNAGHAQKEALAKITGTDPKVLLTFHARTGTTSR